MVDHFALLGLPRQPWVDPTVLRERFLLLSKEHHPDKSSGASELSFASINMAYHCLRTPKNRLAHLLELETGAKPKNVHEVPSELTDFYMRLTQLLREADAFNQQWSSAGQMVKAQIVGQAQDLIEKLQQAQAEINRRTAQLDAEAMQLSASDELQQHAERTSRLEQLHQRYGYYSRLSDQTQERVTRLFI